MSNLISSPLVTVYGATVEGGAAQAFTARTIERARALAAEQGAVFTPAAHDEATLTARFGTVPAGSEVVGMSPAPAAPVRGTMVTPATPIGTPVTGQNAGQREFRGTFAGFTPALPAPRAMVEYRMPGGGTRRSSFDRVTVR